MADIEMLIERNLDRLTGRRLNCAETVLVTMCEYMGIVDGNVPRIATAFGGGLAGTQSVCGIVTGALMAIGLMHGRDEGGDQKPARDVGKQFMQDFEREFGSLTCAGLTGVDLSDPVQAEAFRAPGGAHFTVCRPGVEWTCRYLARLFDEM